jgi:hypothetical protein
MTDMAIYRQSPLSDSFPNLRWAGIDHEAATDFWLVALFRVEIVCDSNRNQADKPILLNAKPVGSGLHAFKLEGSEFMRLRRGYRFNGTAFVFSRCSGIQSQHRTFQKRCVEAYFGLPINHDVFLLWGRQFDLSTQLVDGLPIRLDIGLGHWRVLRDRYRRKSGDRDYGGKERAHICIGHHSQSGTRLRA